MRVNMMDASLALASQGMFVLSNELADDKLIIGAIPSPEITFFVSVVLIPILLLHCPPIQLLMSRFCGSLAK
jgi:hypothetical protein